MLRTNSLARWWKSMTWREEPGSRRCGQQPFRSGDNHDRIVLCINFGPDGPRDRIDGDPAVESVDVACQIERIEVRVVGCSGGRELDERHVNLPAGSGPAHERRFGANDDECPVG